MRRLAFISVSGVTLIGLALGGFWLLNGNNNLATTTTTTATAARSTTTIAVSRRTLQQAEEITASVGYGEKFSLPGMVQGIVTWVPDKGSTLKPGDVLYRVDEQPTTWAKGGIPMYRVLKRGAKGGDVRQLQTYLQDWGYLDVGSEIDGVFGGTLRSAVKAWQKDRGVKETGEVDSAQLLFLPNESLRVAVVPRLGDHAIGGVIEVTSPDLFVFADVSARKKKAFEGDPNIEVELADGSRYPATVSSIEAVQSQDVFGAQQFRVKLVLEAPEGQEPGEVTVAVIDVLVEDALAVPVGALVALVEGGYAVEVSGPDGALGYRVVEIGEFADGWVEVTGDISEGDLVVVAS